MSSCNVILTCQLGDLAIALLEKNKPVDMLIANNPDDLAFTMRRIEDMGLDISLVKNKKVCYILDDAFDILKGMYMDNEQDINIFTNWPFQQGNQGGWVEQHYKFKPLLGKTGKMVAHSTTQFVSGTQRHKGILQDLQESDTTYLDMSTETRFKPKIGVRAGYYVTSNKPYSGKTTVKTIDGKEIDIDITKYSALPCVLSSEIWEVFEEIKKIQKNTFNSFRETPTKNGIGIPCIAVPKARHISWNKKTFNLNPKTDKLPTARTSLLFDLGYYNEAERKSLCSQLDLSITRFWLAIMGWLDSRSGGWICRSIPMWSTDEIYDDFKFFKKYSTLAKYKPLIIDLAGKIKTDAE